MKEWLSKIKHYSVCLLCFLATSNMYLQAQKLWVNGVVTDIQTKEPLIGASVVIKGTTSGVTTDADGKFSLEVNDTNAILVFRFLGYKTEEVVINGKKSLLISLKPDTELLDEIVVIGYGAVRKSDLTGSVSSVKSNDLKAFPATNIVQAMTGRAPGVYVQQKNGSPGGEINVRIRGANSIQGSNEPLYVIDGFLWGSAPANLNPNDIETMEILKDASATAIYGSRGANGVVLITTKRGTAGKTKVEFETSYSIQSIRKKLDLMDASEYATFTNQFLTNDGDKAYFENPASLGKGTDWQDLVLQSAPLTNNNITISGGSEKTQFSVSAGYYNQEGIVKNSDYSRFSTRANITHAINKYISVYAGVMYSQLNSRSKNYGSSNRGNDLFGSMILASPTLTPFNEDGSYRELKTAYPFISNVIANPLNFVYEKENKNKADQTFANAAITIKPFDGFFIKLTGGINVYNSRQNDYTTSKFIGSEGEASLSSSRAQTILNENTVGYTKKFGIHTISAVAGFTYQTNNNTSLGASGTGFISDTPGSYALGTAETFNTPNSGYTDWTMLSYLGRIQYNLMDRYLATVSFRADGSSRYSKGDKWGYFPSGALAWRLSHEDFMKDIDFISDLKLRVGYGETGSTAIDPYYTLNMLSAGKTVLNDDLVTWYAPGTRLPASLRWETTAQTNIGIDLSVFNSRYRLTLDYYIKKTKDLLNAVQLPASLGYTTTIQNVGEIQNKGVEIALDATIFDGDFYWNLAPNIAFNKNKVTKLYGGEDKIGSTFNIGILTDYVNILREGEPLGMFFGYKETGYDDTGKITYEDTDGNGLGYSDRRKIGDPNPDFTYGLNSVMSYKNFEFSFFIQGTYGNDIYNFNAMSVTQDFNYAHNRPIDMFNNTWTPENKNAKYPRASKKNAVNISDRFVEDGSYLRLKNIQLAYNLPTKSWGISSWLKSAQIYISGQNLLTLSGYSWYDPEVNYSGGSNSINLGLDYYTYPTSKSVTFGARLEF